MQLALTKRVEQLVECGWHPETTTETTASLVGRRPFSWWLFLAAMWPKLLAFLLLMIGWVFFLRWYF
ncbi:MAG: hypothetical protein QG595_1778 [Pseudomonadota bacterium]|jgi:hypothetical protein|nr:hypothetical protein [Pseudomonadota bacterium]